METIRFVTQQLPYLAPSLLVYLVGIVLSLTYLKRCFVPATLVLIACVLLMMVLIVVPVLQGVVVLRHNGNPEFGQLLLVGFFGAVLRAVGYALLIAAAFVSRPRERLDSSEPWSDPFERS